MAGRCDVVCRASLDLLRGGERIAHAPLEGSLLENGAGAGRAIGLDGDLAALVDGVGAGETGIDTVLERQRPAAIDGLPDLADGAEVIAAQCPPAGLEPAEVGVEHLAVAHRGGGTAAGFVAGERAQVVERAARDAEHHAAEGCGIDHDGRVLEERARHLDL